jgi:lipopolysaccharide export LptBFGC system permease protein LptF
MTLPVAVLYAATIVYGRFSQDNEYLASRASGISTITLMGPALVIGVIVTVASLALNNWITPVMVHMARGPLAENIEGIAYGQLQRRGFIKFKEDALVHADKVYPEERRLEGVVIIYEPQNRDTTIIAARAAEPHFTEQNRESYLTADLIGPAVIRGQEVKIYLEHWAAPSLPLDRTVREELAWYNLGQLLEFLRDPTSSEPIRREMEKASRRIATEQLAEKLAADINAGGTYDRLEGNDARYIITAGGANVEHGVVRLLPAAAAPGEAPMVRVRVIPKTDSPKSDVPFTVVAPHGEVSSEWLAWSPKTMISAARSREQLKGQGLYLVRVELYGDANSPTVTLTPDPSEGRAERPAHRVRWTRGELLMPQEILSSVSKVDSSDLRNHPEKYTADPSVQKAISTINTRQIPVHRARVIAEINMRAAYGLSCFGMVAMGAALGLLFRGGQIISAFALTMVPSALVLCLAVAGKEMIRNPKVGTTAAGMTTGLSVMWSGPIALMLACVVVYALLVRK